MLVTDWRDILWGTIIILVALCLALCLRLTRDAGERTVPRRLLSGIKAWLKGIKAWLVRRRTLPIKALPDIKAWLASGLAHAEAWLARQRVRWAPPEHEDNEADFTYWERPG